MNNFKGFPSIQNETKEIGEIARAIGGEGFSDMEEEEAKELIETADNHQLLSNEELNDLVTPAGNESGEDEEEKKEEALTINKLNKLLKMAKELSDFVTEIDPNDERGRQFASGVEKLCGPYNELLKGLRDSMFQPKISNFFK